MDHELSKANSAHPSQQFESTARSPRLFVGGLVVNTTKEQLADYFGKFGKVIMVEICGSPNGRSKLFGYVTFEESDTIDKVLQEAELIFAGKSIRAARAMDDNTRKKWHETLINNRVFLTSIPEDSTSHEIAELVSKFGDVKYITKMRKNNKNKLFCCVTMETVGQAELLLKYKTFPFRQGEIRIKRFSTKDKRKSQIKEEDSENSSLYGEDEIGDEIYAHINPKQFEGQVYFPQANSISVNLSKKQKKRLRIKKARELEAYLLEQQASNAYEKNSLSSSGHEMAWLPGGSYTENLAKRLQETAASFEGQQVSQTSMQQRVILGQSKNFNTLKRKTQPLSIGWRSLPYIKYTEKRVLLQTASPERKQTTSWKLFDISLMSPQQLKKLVSTSCSSEVYGNSLNLKFNLRLH